MKLKFLMLIILSSVFSLPAFAAEQTKTTATGGQTTHVANAPSQLVVNINSADEKTFAEAKLKGISKKRAAAIVAYRAAHGPFKSVEDLSKVKGISKSTVEHNKARLKV